MLKMMVMFQQALRRVNNEKGTVAIEYGLIAGLISVALIAGAVLIGPELSEIFNYVATKLQAVVLP